MDTHLTAICVVALAIFWVIGCYIDIGLQQAKEEKVK
jgi:hypothetical protein